MSERDAMILPSPSPDCPSEAVLDAYELGELRDRRQSAHIDSCRVCQAKLAARTAAFLAMPRRDEIVRAVHVAVASSGRVHTPGRRPWFGGAARSGPWRGWIAGAAAAAAVWLAFSAMPDGASYRASDRGREGVRLKGTVGLSVYVERNGHVERAASGDRFRPGERLRFEVDLPKDAEVMIIGREASGRVYPVFPTGPDVVRSRPYRVGTDQILPGAVVLDDSRGKETLYLVTCDAPFDSRQIKVSDARVVTPTGCLTTRLVLDKVAP